MLHPSATILRGLTRTVAFCARPIYGGISRRHVSRRYHAAEAAPLEGSTASTPTALPPAEQEPVALLPARTESGQQEAAAAAAAAAAAPKTVAELDASKFKVDASSWAWQNFTRSMPAAFANPNVKSGSNNDVQLLLDHILDNIEIKDAQSAAYWGYHISRLSFFVTQGMASLVTHHTYETVLGDARVSSVITPFERMTQRNAFVYELLNRSAEAVGAWKQDYKYIEQGMYKLPWDMTTLSHRQFNPLFQLSKTVQFMVEGTQTLRRRIRGIPEKVWMDSAMYPDYYMKTFHFQTDGWFSNWSASIYEHSTEVLFFGRQDAMQRLTLVPIADFMAANDMDYLAGRDPRSVRLLELACGTGRFHTFIKDNYPDMPTVASDLSPFYLAKARENLKYWKSKRQPNKDLGGVDKTGTEFLQTAAESIGAPDNTFDIVVAVYLFHELPPEARRKAVSEMFRVTKPGGMVVFTDSVQTGDRPEWDNNIHMFGTFNEPHWETFTTTDFGAMFEEAGFVCHRKHVSSATKTLSFYKPNPDNN